jgi:hypothetical protein
VGLPDAGGPKPPNGKTLALLCLKLVKHTSGAKIGEKKQVIEKQMNLTAAEFRKWQAVDAEHFLFSSVVVVFPRLRRGRRLTALTKGLTEFSVL